MELQQCIMTKTRNSFIILFNFRSHYKKMVFQSVSLYFKIHLVYSNPVGIVKWQSPKNGDCHQSVEK